MGQFQYFIKILLPTKKGWHLSCNISLPLLANKTWCTYFKVSEDPYKNLSQQKANASPAYKALCFICKDKFGDW